MELNKSNKINFWNDHTLNDFEPIAYLHKVHSHKINYICFLKDGRIASSEEKCVLIFNKITFKKELIILETKQIKYMNITKDGILINCLCSTFLNLYEINGKKYKIIQTIKPYSLFKKIINIFYDYSSILKFKELKNEDLVFFACGYGICFYRKNKGSKKYSYLTKYSEKKANENITDLIELDNNQYIILFHYQHMIQFLDMNSKKINKIIKYDIDFYLPYFKDNLLLMNKNDLFLLLDRKILIIDIQKKEIIKEIYLNGDVCSMYKISSNILIVGYWFNYIEKLEYDEIKKKFKVISKTKMEVDEDYSFEISSIGIYKNNLIVTPYNNQSYPSLIIYKYK